MLACWHVDSAVNVEINYLKIPHLWKSLPLSWKIFPISWKICPNSWKSSPNTSIWAGLPWIWKNLPWNWKNHGMSHPLLPQHWHTLLQLINNCFHVGVTMAHDCTIAKSQRKLIGSWGRIVRMKFGREDSPMPVKKKCWMSWGRGLAVRKNLFTTCKLRTNSACEDEYMLVRKKQCLEILNPGCGTCIYDEMSSSLGYWTMTLDIITSSFCQVYQQGGDLLVPPNYSAIYSFGSDEILIK